MDVEHSNEQYLYHYTTFKTLMSIVNYRQLWLTDFRFLNDSSEFRIYTQHLKNTVDNFDFRSQRLDLENRISHKDKEQQINIKRGFDQYVYNLKEAIGRLHERNGLPNLPKKKVFYIFSLSKNKDSLSQWRAYGNGELCLKFDVSSLRSLTNSPIIKVKYVNKNEKIDSVNWIIQHMCEAIIERAVRNDYIDREIIDEVLHPFHNSTDEMLSFMRDSSLKHIGFKDEEEYRVVYSNEPEGYTEKENRQNQKNSEVFLHAAKYLTPKAVIHFPENLKFEELIPGVVFGPGMDQLRCAASIDFLRTSHNLNLSCEFSDIPFRS